MTAPRSPSWNRRPRGAGQPGSDAVHLTTGSFEDKPAWNIDKIPCDTDDPLVMPVEHLEARISYHSIVPPHSGERLNLHEAIWVCLASARARRAGC